MDDQVLKLTFPGGSKSRVNRAGDNISNSNENLDDLTVIEVWRAAHRAVLNTFNESLRRKTKGTNIIVAQRHKRRSTIIGKLSRYPSMKLSRMDDVAGFRLIFSGIDELNLFREKFHKAKFRHTRLNEIDKYDYIKHPKKTGYRGIHDVYRYDVNSKAGRHLKGLLVELQYRTLIQHSWATAVEVIGFITESQPKFEEGDKRYQYAMSLGSEIIARSFEDSYGPYPDLDNYSLIKEFKKIEKKLNLLTRLRGLEEVGELTAFKQNAILIFSKKGDLTIKLYRNQPEALENLFLLEKQYPDDDIVLVKADRGEDIRLAFKNYFSDANEFVKLIENGYEILG